jgi:FtsH-binding integral membrane protein
LLAEECVVMRFRLVPSLYALGIVVIVLSLVVDTFVKSEAVYLAITLVGVSLCGIAAYFTSE